MKSFLFVAFTFIAVDFVSAAQQNVAAPLADPHHVKVVCEHAGTAWLVFLSLCVVVVRAKRHGVRHLFRAPKCAIGAVVGGVILGTGLWCVNDWATALGGILVVLSHVSECTAHAISHLFDSHAVGANNVDSDGGSRTPPQQNSRS